MSDRISIGVNIRSTKNCRYALEIARGNKTLETRASDSLRCYVGRRVGLIETGNGKARLLGYATIGEPIQIEAESFDDHYAAHLVARDDPFYPSKDAIKYCYPMLDAIPCAPRVITSKGIKARRI